MERVEVYAILMRHFSGEEAEAIINYIDEKKTGTTSLHALKKLELKIMEKIYKLKEKVAYAFIIGFFLMVLFFMVLARAISNLTP